jgi:hypothetical protein
MGNKTDRCIWLQGDFDGVWVYTFRKTLLKYEIGSKIGTNHLYLLLYIEGAPYPVIIDFTCMENLEKELARFTKEWRLNGGKIDRSINIK